MFAEMKIVCVMRNSQAQLVIRNKGMSAPLTLSSFTQLECHRFAVNNEGSARL